MKDRAMQALHLLALAPVAETTADKNSYGFRPGRSTADAIGQSFLMLSHKDSATWVLEGDLRGCFDNISHEWMLRQIPTDKAVLRKWLKAGFVEKRILFPTEAGTPQGGIVSPTLANLTLDGLERMLKEKFSGKRTPSLRVNLIRYADDFIITGTSKELLENEVKPLVEQFLRDRGLQLSPEKTCVTHIENGFDFLGQNLRKHGGKLLIQPSKKIRTDSGQGAATHSPESRTQPDRLDTSTQPRYSRLGNYHRHVVAKRMFRKVEWACGTAWRWARRRHSGSAAAGLSSDIGTHWVTRRCRMIPDNGWPTENRSGCAW
jgi:RNA-directed DNA polymerase